jgi:hypothetical protein
MGVKSKSREIPGTATPGGVRVPATAHRGCGHGLDPNVWVQNVEVVVAKDVGRETVRYVSNVSNCYTVCSLFRDQFDVKQDVKAGLKAGN